jgi:hypothetical protein
MIECAIAKCAISIFYSIINDSSSREIENKRKRDVQQWNEVLPKRKE